MKKVLLVLFILIGTASLAQKPEKGFLDKKSRSEIARYLKSASFREIDSDHDYDLIYQRMDWQIDPAVVYIKGSVTSYFKSTVQDLATIRFDMHDSLSVDSITGGGQLLDYTHLENTLTVQLNRQYNLSETDSFTIFYQGKPNGSGFGSFIQDKHNGIPIIWTLSEPYGAKDWWPCKQSLADKIDSIDVIVKSPEQYRTAGNGVLVSEKVEGGQRVMHWKHRYAIATYLVAVAVTNYVDYFDYLVLENGDSVEILNYVYPEDLESSRQKTPQTTDIMKLYNSLFGVYPFANEKYGHAQFGWGGGMEHQTMSFMGDFSFELIAHELAHQWFGDYITLGSWHDIWLNEGFATYLTGLTYERLLGGVWWRPWKEQVHRSVTSSPGGSVYVVDTTDVSRIFNSRLSYRKGAYLLQMLRWIMGDGIFFQAIKEYVNDPGIANGFASQEELVNHLEAAADTSLAEFFNDWYYGEGFPVYSIKYEQKNDQEVIIILSQETTHPSVDFFEMPVPVRVWNSDSTQYKDFRLNHTYNGQPFEINPGFKVSGIEIDPDLWLISQTGQIMKTPELLLPDVVKVFPNPTYDKIGFSIPPGKFLREVSLYSIDGGLIKQFSYTKANNTLDLSQFPKGSYVLQFDFGGDLVEKKIIKL